MRTALAAFLVLALTQSALADPTLDDVAVVRDRDGQTVLLFPPPQHPLLLDLKNLEGKAFAFGDRDSAVGTAVITGIAPDDNDNSMVTLDGLAESGPMVGFAGTREWVKPLASPPDSPIIAAVIAAQVRSLGEKGALESATAWRAPESNLLFLEVRALVAGTKREDYAGNEITGLYMFRWTGHDWLVIRADTTVNHDGPETGDIHVIAVAINAGHGLDLVLQWDRYESEILQWQVFEGDSMSLSTELCLGICS